ncbi:hypothetical protein SNEBB_002144 [Seison nebaliae]|nr:hypothetical protein SNEBB_002144 [Seison nebaliae]
MIDDKVFDKDRLCNSATASLRQNSSLNFIANEWFIPNTDVTLVDQRSDYQACLHEDFPLLNQRLLYQKEWYFIRCLLGNARRCSQSFFMEEKKLLYEKRKKVRALQQRKISESKFEDFKDLGERIPVPLVIGNKVIARTRGTNTKEIGFFNGTIRAVDTVDNTYRIEFDKVTLGTRTICDLDVRLNEFALEYMMIKNFLRKHRFYKTTANVPLTESSLHDLRPNRERKHRQQLQLQHGRRNRGRMSSNNKHSSHRHHRPKSPQEEEVVVEDKDNSDEDTAIKHFRNAMPMMIKLRMNGDKLGPYPFTFLLLVVRWARAIEMKHRYIRLMKEVNDECEMMSSFHIPLENRHATKLMNLVRNSGRLNRDIRSFSPNIKPFLDNVFIYYREKYPHYEQPAISNSMRMQFSPSFLAPNPNLLNPHLNPNNSMMKYTASGQLVPSGTPLRRQGHYQILGNSMQHSRHQQMHMRQDLMGKDILTNYNYDPLTFSHYFYKNGEFVIDIGKEHPNYHFKIDMNLLHSMSLNELYLNGENYDKLMNVVDSSGEMETMEKDEEKSNEENSLYEEDHQRTAIFTASELYERNINECRQDILYYLRSHQHLQLSTTVVELISRLSGLFYTLGDISSSKILKNRTTVGSAGAMNVFNTEILSMLKSLGYRRCMRFFKNVIISKFKSLTKASLHYGSLFASFMEPTMVLMENETEMIDKSDWSQLYESQPSSKLESIRQSLELKAIWDLFLDFFITAEVEKITMTPPAINASVEMFMSKMSPMNYQERLRYVISGKMNMVRAAILSRLFNYDQIKILLRILSFNSVNRIYFDEELLARADLFSDYQRLKLECRMNYWTNYSILRINRLQPIYREISRRKRMNESMAIDYCMTVRRQLNGEEWYILRKIESLKQKELHGQTMKKIKNLKIKDESVMKSNMKSKKIKEDLKKKKKKENKKQIPYESVRLRSIILDALNPVELATREEVNNYLHKETSISLMEMRDNEWNPLNNKLGGMRICEEYNGLEYEVLEVQKVRIQLVRAKTAKLIKEAPFSIKMKLEKLTKLKLITEKERRNYLLEKKGKVKKNKIMKEKKLGEKDTTITKKKLSSQNRRKKEIEKKKSIPLTIPRTRAAYRREKLVGRPDMKEEKVKKVIPKIPLIQRRSNRLRRPTEKSQEMENAKKSKQQQQQQQPPPSLPVSSESKEKIVEKKVMKRSKKDKKKKEVGKKRNRSKSKVKCKGKLKERSESKNKSKKLKNEKKKMIKEKKKREKSLKKKREHSKYAIFDRMNIQVRFLEYLRGMEKSLGTEYDDSVYSFKRFLIDYSIDIKRLSVDEINRMKNQFHNMILWKSQEDGKGTTNKRLSDETITRFMGERECYSTIVHQKIFFHRKQKKYFNVKHMSQMESLLGRLEDMFCRQYKHEMFRVTGMGNGSKERRAILEPFFLHMSELVTYIYSSDLSLLHKSNNKYSYQLEHIHINLYLIFLRFEKLYERLIEIENDENVHYLRQLKHVCRMMLMETSSHAAVVKKCRMKLLFNPIDNPKMMMSTILFLEAGMSNRQMANFSCFGLDNDKKLLNNLKELKGIKSNLLEPKLIPINKTVDEIREMKSPSSLLNVSTKVPRRVYPLPTYYEPHDLHKIMRYTQMPTQIAPLPPTTPQQIMKTSRRSKKHDSGSKRIPSDVSGSKRTSKRTRTSHGKTISPANPDNDLNAEVSSSSNVTRKRKKNSDPKLKDNKLSRRGNEGQVDSPAATKEEREMVGVHEEPTNDEMVFQPII